MKEHSEFWADVLEECGTPEGFQFLIDDQGQKIAVLLDFEQHGSLWEDVYDSLIIESRKDEPRIPFEEVKRQLNDDTRTIDISAVRHRREVGVALRIAKISCSKSASV